MNISIAEDRSAWNNFVLRYSRDEFLQSWDWGEFQKSYGREVWRLEVKKNGVTVAIANTVCLQIPGGKKFVYVPRGPIFKRHILEAEYDMAWSLLMQNLRLIGLESNSFFVRIEPPTKEICEGLAKESETALVLLKKGWRQTKAVQPQFTLVLSLEKTAAELLQAMHHKTRYNIGLAEKKGLSIRSLDTKQELDVFWKLLATTSKRDIFSLYDFSYYRKLFNILYADVDDDRRQAKVKIWLVEKNNKPLATALVVLFGHTVYYLYGGSDDVSRNLMPAYFLHWRIILWAQKNGYKFYDFWGVKNPQAGDDHSWSGLSKFKHGFGGQVYRYAGTFDFPYRPLVYCLYRLAKKIKRYV